MQTAPDWVSLQLLPSAHFDVQTASLFMPENDLKSEEASGGI